MAAGHGTDHVGIGACRRHGGNTSIHVHAAQRHQAEQLVATYGLPRTIPAAVALQEEQARTVGAVDWLTDVIRAQDPEALAWGLAMEERQEGGESLGTTRRFEARPSVWVQIFQTEREHLRRVARDIQSLGLEERQVRLAEQESTRLSVLLGGAVREILDELGLSADQRDLVPRVVAKHLRVARDALAGAEIDGEVVP
jgi:hypothetical protein